MNTCIQQSIPFDQIILDIILQVMILDGDCLIKNQLMVSRRLPDAEGKVIGTFYTHISCVTQLISNFLINEEISNSSNRALYPSIKTSLIERQASTFGLQIESEILFAHAFRSLEESFINRVNFLIGSSLFDFSISAYSAFEYWVSKIYESQNLEQARNSKKKENIRSYIKKCQIEGTTPSDSTIEKIMQKNSLYTSSSEKIDQVFKLVKEKYKKRNFNKDKEIVKFLQTHRNTIHNGGINLKNKTCEITVDEFNIKLPQGKPASTEDWRSFVYLSYKLIEIYEEIEKCLPDLDYNHFIDLPSE